MSSSSSIRAQTQPRAGGRFASTGPALERFAKLCTFDPTTGCVVWTGGTTSGRGNSARYGSFWFEGRRWAAHRWAAIYIHGLDLNGFEAGHCCPNTGGRPNTLCVEHVQAQGKLENIAEGNRTRHIQPNDVRQFYLFLHLGIERAEPVWEGSEFGIPLFTPPKWFVDARPDYVLPPLAEVPF